MPIELVARPIAPVEPAHAPGEPGPAAMQPRMTPVVAATDESWSERTSLFGEPEA